MKERAILFSGPMVQAILDGRKTQTRRIVTDFGAFHNGVLYCGGRHGLAKALCPYGQPGDRLWVRETWARRGEMKAAIYKADEAKALGAYGAVKWTPSIHMPRWASRITLEITEIRVQRLQEISEQDASEEGCTLLGRTVTTTDDLSLIPAFKDLWESINGGGTWSANPWVWCVSFKEVTR